MGSRPDQPCCRNTLMRHDKSWAERNGAGAANPVRFHFYLGPDLIDGIAHSNCVARFQPQPLQDPRLHRRAPRAVPQCEQPVGQGSRIEEELAV